MWGDLSWPPMTSPVVVARESSLTPNPFYDPWGEKKQIGWPSAQSALGWEFGADRESCMFRLDEQRLEYWFDMHYLFKQFVYEMFFNMQF